MFYFKHLLDVHRLTEALTWLFATVILLQFLFFLKKRSFHFKILGATFQRLLSGLLNNN